MYNLKKTAILLMTTTTMLASFPNMAKVSAATNDNLGESDMTNSPLIVERDNKLYMENFEISYQEKADVIEITVVDLENGDVSVAEVDAEAKTLSIDSQDTVLEIEDNVYSLNDMSVNSISTYGPYQTNYSINAASAAVVVGLIVGIAAIVSAASTAGLSLAALKSGLSSAWAVISNVSTIDWISGSVTVYGYFRYSQQVDTSTNRARNINRIATINVSQWGITKASNSYNYGSGEWFYYVRPYSESIAI